MTIGSRRFLPIMACLAIVGISERVTARAPVAQAPPANGTSHSLGRIEMRLWYTRTGRLSGNVAPPAKVTLWNTVIGEGDAQEAAHDAIATVEILSSRTDNFAPPLRIEAQAKGKIVASRTVNNIVANTSGRSTEALWIPDIGCAGPVTVTARLGAHSKAITVRFDCGE